VVTALLSDWPKEKNGRALASGSLMEPKEVAAPCCSCHPSRNVTIRDLVIVPNSLTFDGKMPTSLTAATMNGTRGAIGRSERARSIGIFALLVSRDWRVQVAGDASDDKPSPGPEHHHFLARGKHSSNASLRVMTRQRPPCASPIAYCPVRPCIQLARR
jgi:hypothetical protein